MCRCVFPPPFVFFFLYISTSLLSIHHDLSAGFLSHSPQTLALLQMGIDPTVNLISTILCRAFSFTALHSAKQTWLFHGVVYRSENETVTQLRESCDIKPTCYQKQKRYAEECANAVPKSVWS